MGDLLRHIDDKAAKRAEQDLTASLCRLILHNTLCKKSCVANGRMKLNRFYQELCSRKGKLLFCKRRKKEGTVYYLLRLISTKMVYIFHTHPF